MENFRKLGLSSEVTTVLKELGFEKPSEIQEKTIPLAMAGKDIIGGSATGSGKTLAFSSSIIEKSKRGKGIQALVLTPTRELAEQVSTSIKEFGKNKNLNVLAIYGGTRIESQIKKLHSVDVLVGTPGRILDHLNRRTLKLGNVKILVIDEVDRLFDMGFGRDVEKILLECPEKRQTMLFSATISPEIDYLAQKYTRNPEEVAVKSYVDHSKLEQVYYDVPDNKKFSLLVSLLRKEDSKLVMVFCNTRRNVDFITKNLINSGIDAMAIHGGLEQKKRIRVLESFHKGELGVLVCTDVAARGLDIKKVSHVYNYDSSKDPKDYIHRIGRTARAGKEGKAITIIASRDYENFGNLVQKEKIKITPVELPQLDFVRIVSDSKRHNDNRQRDPRRGAPRRSNQRNSGRNSRRNSNGDRRSSNRRSRPNSNRE